MTNTGRSPKSSSHRAHRRREKRQLASPPLPRQKPARNRSGGAWLSLVERLLWEQEVVGSNPAAPTSLAGLAAMGIGASG